jgi:hypothetical protein
VEWEAGRGGDADREIEEIFAENLNTESRSTIKNQMMYIMTTGTPIDG